MISSYQLPEKCTIYTTLIGLLNARNYNCGGEFVEMMLRELKRLIYLNRHDEAQYVVEYIFYILLVFVFHLRSFLSIWNYFHSGQVLGWFSKLSRGDDNIPLFVVRKFVLRYQGRQCSAVTLGLVILINNFCWTWSFTFGALLLFFFF